MGFALSMCTSVSSICNLKQEKDEIVNIFWNSVIIRKEFIKNYIASLKFLTIEGDKVIKEEWDNRIVEKHLISSKYRNESLIFWTFVYEKYSNCAYSLLVALLFICEKDTDEEKELKLLLLLDYNLVEEVNNKLCIKRSKLTEILKIYLDIISYLSVEYLQHIISEEEYVKTRKEAYGDTYQNEFIKRLFEPNTVTNTPNTTITTSNEINNPDEFIEVTTFLHNHYELLVNNQRIRAGLYSLWLLKG